MEACDDRGQEVGAGNPRGGQRERPKLRIAAPGKRSLRVSEQRLSPQDVVGEHLAGRRQHRATAIPDEELGAELGLEQRDMLRHRWLTDVQIVGRSRERAFASDGGECTKPRLQFHYLRLYKMFQRCI